MAVVGEAENGMRAVELVKRHQPDILLLDVEMPVMSGIEVVRLLVKNGNPPKIIVLSNYSDHEFVNNLLRLGVVGYIAKEEAPECLAEAIDAVHQGAVGWVSPGIQSYAA
jgi:DNA-binding NarL/FixJ family response regulator